MRSLERSLPSVVKVMRLWLVLRGLHVASSIRVCPQVSPWS